MKFSRILGLILGGSLTLSQATERVYIACGNVGIRVAEFDSENGTLTEPQEAISLAGAGFLAVHPKLPIVYATCKIKGEGKASGGLAALKMGEDGSLDLMNEVSTMGSGPCHVSLDETGKVAFAANYGSGSVASFQITPDGSLSPAVSAIQHEGSSVHSRQKGPHAHYFGVGPQNQYAYSPDLGLDKVLIYRFDPESAKLTAAGAGLLEAGAGPRHMKFSKDGQFAFVLNELSLTVTSFAYDKEDGSLTSIGSVPVMPAEEDRERVTCAEILVHPNGRFVYTSQRDLRTGSDKDIENLGRNSISVFSINEDGTLEHVQTISAGVKVPRNFAFDPSGKWVLVGGQRSNDIRIFAVDGESGKLSSHGEPISCPGAICFDFVPKS